MAYTRTYEIAVTLRVRVEADSMSVAKDDCIKLAEEIQRELPTGASIDAINGDSLREV